MFKHLISLILACLLLCGCAEMPAPEETKLPPEAAHTVSPVPICSYDGGNALEQRTRGAVRVYSLNVPATGIRSMGKSVLLFSGEENTTLTLLAGDSLEETASIRLDGCLLPEDPSLQISEAYLSCFDPIRRETLVLDDTLQISKRISAPNGLIGTPVLSPDAAELYYCDSTAIRALDVSGGHCRCLRQVSRGYTGVTGIHLEGTVLACAAEDGSIHYISASNGRLLTESAALRLGTYGSRYYAAFPTGMTAAMLSGTAGEAPQALTPASLTGECFFLPEADAAVTAAAVSPEQLRLDYYDLSSGLRRSSLTLAASGSPAGVAWADGMVYVLMDGSLYRWDVSQTALHDDRVYTGPYYTPENPDRDGLARCQARAKEMGEAFGIRILLLDEAAAAAPPDADFQPEYLVPVIEYQLTQLEQALAQFPEGMLQSTASNFDSLSICLVRQISGQTDGGGLQYFLGKDAYIALPAGETMTQALYHTLYHVMETHIWNRSIALDQWEALNPKGFTYDLDFEKNQAREGTQYLLEETRAFIDTYAMSFPKEDRARIMEYACTPGMEDCFQSEPMQRKLRTLCLGIREAYGLEKGTADLLWEQYLLVPMI